MHRRVGPPTILIAAATVCACVSVAAPARAEEDAGGPARIEAAGEGEAPRITLTEKALARIDLKTEAARAAEAGHTAVPYASVLYDVDGTAWVYASTTPATFVRRSVVVDAIAGDEAILSDGPPAGTQVVAVGVAQLYGVEQGVGED